jgi:hypothetical protein
MSAKLLLSLGAVVLLVLALVVAPSPTMSVSVAAGHVGVLYKRFAGGTDVENVYDEGFHFVWPWNNMYVYDARVQTRSATLAPVPGTAQTCRLMWRLPSARRAVTHPCCTSISDPTTWKRSLCRAWAQPRARRYPAIRPRRSIRPDGSRSNRGSPRVCVDTSRWIPKPIGFSSAWNSSRSTRSSCTTWRCRRRDAVLTAPLT